MKKENKKLNKILIIIIAVLILLMIVIIALPEPEVEEPTATVPTTQDVSTRKESIGKSDQPIEEYADSIHLSSMLNDATGDWKIATVTSGKDFTKYAVDYYYKYYVKDEGGSSVVHWIVDFQNNITISITDLGTGTYLDVNIYEYVENEEHDAKKIGGGLPYGHYMIYLDNWDIEKV